MPWQPYTHNGLVFDLSHLDDFEHTFIQAATSKDTEKTYRVLISFTNHCFTDSMNEDNGEIFQRDGRHARYFNLKRWRYSKFLPDLIRELQNLPVYVVNDNSYFSFKVIDDQGQELEYEIYFDVFFDKTTKRILMMIKSAYTRDSESSQRPLTNNNNRVRLFVLLNAAQQGKRVHRKY
jgi:hypothetical protein